MKTRSRTLYICIGVGIAMLILLITLFVDLPAREAEGDAGPETTLQLVYAYQNNAWNSCIEEVVRQFEEAYPPH